MEDFYVVINNRASIKSFPNNTVGDFKAVLSDEVDLNNVDYKVAIASITRYYETPMQDIAVVREKRATPSSSSSLRATLEVVDKFPDQKETDVAIINKQYAEYLRDGDPVYIFSDNLVPDYTYKLKVGEKEKEFTINTSQQTVKSKLEDPEGFYRSDSVFEGLTIELSDMDKIGRLTFVGMKQAGVVCTVTFSKYFKEKFQLAQMPYSQTWGADKKTRYNVSLRDDKKLPKWVDLRTTLPYMLKLPEKELPVTDPEYKATLFLFEKLDGAYADYKNDWFIGTEKSLSILPKSDEDSQRHLKLHPMVAKALKLPEALVITDQFVDLYVSQNSADTLFESFKVRKEDMATIEDVDKLFTRINLKTPDPHSYASQIGLINDAPKGQLQISEGLKIKIPHVLNYIPFESTPRASVWSCSIFYVSDDGVGQTEKKFQVPYRKTYAKQTEELQRETEKVFTEIAKEIDAAEKKKNTAYVEGTTKLPFKIHRPRNALLIESIDIPTGYELKLPGKLAESLKLKSHIYLSDINDYAWFTCNLVKEMSVGECRLPLLTPTPQKITSNVVACREYVPVAINKFNQIELKLYTNLHTMVLFDGPYNISVVLHFTPKYKRRGYEDNEKDSKRFCNGRCSGGVLQQTSSGGCA
jgi:hypothetical protein